jgi:hypothetical protein
MQAVRTLILVGTVMGYSLLPLGQGWAAEATPPALPQLPAVACVFELSVFSEEQNPILPPRQWYLWRQSERVERQDIQQGESDIWQRGRDGQVFYERVFHRDRRIIEFVPGDLRALQKYPDWQKLLHVIDPAWLREKLQPTGTTTVLGRQAQRYQGRVEAIEVEVLWLEAEQLPALVRQKYPQREEVLRLRELYPLPHAPWPRANTEHYRRIDYADLGDMHNDPWVRRMQQGEQRIPMHRHLH